MRIDVFTIFPDMFKSPLAEGMLRIAQEKNLVQVTMYDLRDFTDNRHRQVDDEPYGGGVGMVMKPEPFFEGVSSLAPNQNLKALKKTARIILFTPQGKTLNQSIAKSLAEENHLILLCGRYEGVDERVREYLATDEISIGDYILSGGELPAMVLIEAVSRLVLGVLGDEYSIVEETFANGLLEYPQYTRPATYRGWSVPEVLSSGNHQEIARWRRQRALERTFQQRPNLLKEAKLSAEDREFLKKLK